MNSFDGLISDDEYGTSDIAKSVIPFVNIFFPAPDPNAP